MNVIKLQIQIFKHIVKFNIFVLYIVKSKLFRTFICKLIYINKIMRLAKNLKIINKERKYLRQVKLDIRYR